MFKIFFTSIHLLWSSADHFWRALPPPRDITYRSLENQHEDFRGSRWIEQLDGDLLTGCSLIYLRLEILEIKLTMVDVVVMVGNE